MRSWCVFVKLILALIRIQLFWSSFMNIECPYIRPSSHSSNSWSRSWLDEGVEECEPWRETGWKRCNPAPGCRHKLPKFDKISFTQSIQLTLVHSPQRQILDPLESQLRAWAGPSWVTDFRAASREQGWSSFLVSPSWKIFCKTFFDSSHHVWCHRNLTPLLVSALSSAPDPGPGSDVWLKCLPRPTRAQWRSFLEITSRDTARVTQSLRWVIAGIMTLLRLAPVWISVTMTTLTRLGRLFNPVFTASGWIFTRLTQF